MNPIDVRLRARPLLRSLAPLPFLFLLVAAPLASQDFRFSRPWVTVSGYLGWSWPGESTDVFQDTRTFLTVGEGEFAAPLIGAEAALRLTERLDVAVGAEHSDQSTGSEMRDYVTEDDQPIRQRTEFRRTRLMGSVKAYLLERGRSISRYAWIPARWAPYVGGGAGLAWYSFEQQGDFVDYQTLDIFEDRLHSSGRGTTVHAAAGVDVSLSPSFLVRAEFRRIWGETGMEGRAFEGYDVDLSESRIVIGIAGRI